MDYLTDISTTPDHALFVIAVRTEGKPQGELLPCCFSIILKHASSVCAIVCSILNRSFINGSNNDRFVQVWHHHEHAQYAPYNLKLNMEIVNAATNKLDHK